VGYQFKYPDCWEIIIDDPYEDGPMNTIRHIFIRERPSCLTKQLSRDVYPNGIGIVGGSGPRQKRSDAIKEIEFRESRQPSGYLVFKHFKLGGADVIACVDKNSSLRKDIIWKAKVYCPDWWISITGPAIDEPNVDKAIYEKFKKGDLALPEPYNTVINSIRCIPAKQKEDPD
jgi:hypothetical protein